MCCSIFTMINMTLHWTGLVSPWEADALDGILSRLGLDRKTLSFLRLSHIYFFNQIDLIQIIFLGVIFDCDIFIQFSWGREWWKVDFVCFVIFFLRRVVWPCFSVRIMERVYLLFYLAIDLSSCFNKYLMKYIPRNIVSYFLYYWCVGLHLIVPSAHNQYAWSFIHNIPL